MVEALSKEGISQEPESCGVRQDFHCAFPGTGQYTPHRLRWGRLVIPSIPGDSGRTGRGNLIFFGCGKPEMGPFQALSRTPRRLRLPSHGHYRGVPRAERAFAFDSGKALTVMLRVDDYRVLPSELSSISF